MHKNWPEIAKLGQDNPSLMYALLLADPKSDSGRKLISDYPHCFSDTPRPFNPNVHGMGND